ncbi:MAG: GtrA family protein [Ruminococcaceae bacterium]|nr:GtrA family protein [Oscillospiraceae bacterium]
MKELWMYFKHFDMHNLFRAPTHNPFIQFFRYIFVGGFATIADWAVFYILDSTHPEWMYFSTALAFLAGLGVNYVLSKHFVFPLSSKYSKLTEFAVYIVTGLVGLGLTELIMFILASKLGVGHMMTKIIATATVFAWNFGSKKYLLYRKRHFK